MPEQQDLSGHVSIVSPFQSMELIGVDEVDDFYEQTLLVSFAPILIGASSRISRQHNIFLIRINLRMITALVPSHSGI